MNCDGSWLIKSVNCPWKVHNVDLLNNHMECNIEFNRIGMLMSYYSEITIMLYNWFCLPFYFPIPFIIYLDNAVYKDVVMKHHYGVICRLWHSSRRVCFFVSPLPANSPRKWQRPLTSWHITQTTQFMWFFTIHKDMVIVKALSFFIYIFNLHFLSLCKFVFQK